MSDDMSRLCPLSTLPVIIGILGATSFGAIGISLYGACKLCRAGKLPEGKTIIWMTVIFYVTCILNSICNMPYQISLCYSAGLRFQQILRFPRHFGYLSHWISMCGIFFVRLKQSFHSTSTQLPKCHQHVFLAVMSVILLLFYVFEIDIYTSATSTMDTTVIMENVTAFIMTLILTIYSQSLILLFVRGLRLIIKLSQTDSQSISIMVRQIILVIVSLMSSTLVICAYFVGAHYVKDRDQADWYTLTGTIILSLDVFIDVICVSLGLSFYDPVYYHLCAAPDRCIKSRCTRTGSRRGASAMEIELVACSTFSEDEQTAGKSTPNSAKADFVQMSTIEDDIAMATGVNEEDQMISHLYDDSSNTTIVFSQ